MASHSSILAWRIPGQRNLMGYSPWSHKESKTTEQLSILTVKNRLQYKRPGFNPWVGKIPWIKV